MRTHTITLTPRQVTLIRVAMLQRLDRIKDHALPQVRASYDETRAMLLDDGPLSLVALKERAPTAAEIGSPHRQRDLSDLTFGDGA
jgi:hypothetical protein